MKTFWIFRTIVVVSALAFIPVSMPANAQISQHTMVANVPFGFELGSKHLAPGRYTISTPMDGVVEIRSTTDSAIVLTYSGQSSKPTKTAKIVFDQCGNHYFLRQLWFNAEENSYLESPESKAEKQAKKSELASNTKNAPNVELALLRLP